MCARAKVMRGREERGSSAVSKEVPRGEDRSRRIARYRFPRSADLGREARDGRDASRRSTTRRSPGAVIRKQ